MKKSGEQECCHHTQRNNFRLRPTQPCTPNSEKKRNAEHGNKWKAICFPVNCKRRDLVQRDERQKPLELFVVRRPQDASTVSVNEVAYPKSDDNPGRNKKRDGSNTSADEG